MKLTPRGEWVVAILFIIVFAIVMAAVGGIEQS